jgi:hypothetical protein
MKADASGAASPDACAFGCCDLVRQGFLIRQGFWGDGDH